MKFSISNLSLKRRVWIAIALISLLPLIVLLYYFYGYYVSIVATVVLCFVVFLGWAIVFKVFKAITRICTHSKSTLEEIGEELPEGSDEVRGLEDIVNVLSNRVKEGLDQLKEFSQMTGKLDKEVSRKVLILSTVLQANDLFSSKEASAEEVIKFITEHLTELIGAQICFCNLKENIFSEMKVVSCAGIDSGKIKSFIESKGDELSRLKKKIVVDNNNTPKAYLSWPKIFEMKNIAFTPIASKGQTIGLVGIGNAQDNFSFSKDDFDVLELFSQNVALIWEHERLSSKVEELEILDYLTGLYNEKTLVRRLNSEIKRATTYQRPCGFITVKIEKYEEYQKNFGLIEAEKILKRIAKTVKKILRPIDIAGRVGADTLGAILIEANKRQSQAAANNLKKALMEICTSEITLSFSIAESPINGVTALELIQFAKAHITTDNK